MNDDSSPRDARLAATCVLPAIAPPPTAQAAGDDFAATTLDRPTFDLEALAASAPSAAPTIAPPDRAPPPAPARERPKAPPESDAILWIVLALLAIAALGMATGLAVGLASALERDAAAEIDDARGG